MRTALTSAATQLVELFRSHNFTASAIAHRLGTGPHAALFRGEPAAVRRVASDDTAFDFFVRSFLLHDTAPASEWVRWLGQPLVDALTTARSLEPNGTSDDALDPTLRCVIDIRPHVIAGHDRWIFSDADATMAGHIPGKDHVLGVGSASLSLAQSVPSSPVKSLLDVGTGCGIQLLAQSDAATQLTGTDIHPRALDYAEATCAAAGLQYADLLEGAWFEPVRGRRYERIVSNPPFVVGLPEVGHVYRDSGLSLDGASQLMISQAPEHLTVGGTAHLVAAWVHKEGESWQQRVASWLPDHGVVAWILQRDVVDPELYVGTWLRDESLDPRDPIVAEQATTWLNFFHEQSVTGIGFGYVAIQRVGSLDDGSQPSEVVAEELHHDFSDPLGPEVEDYLVRSAWLRNTTMDDIAHSQLAVRPGVAIEHVDVTSDINSGFSPAVVRVTRTDGPRWSHDIDEHLAAILAGLNPHGLNLEETASLYFLSQGIDVSPVLMNDVIAAIVDLLRHGIVLPSDLLELDTATHGKAEA